MIPGTPASRGRSPTRDKTAGLLANTIVRALINVHNFALFQRKIRELGLVEGLTNQIAGKLRKFPCTSDYAILMNY